MYQTRQDRQIDKEMNHRPVDKDRSMDKNLGMIMKKHTDRISVAQTHAKCPMAPFLGRHSSS